jgi:hypothetical protein
MSHRFNAQNHMCKEGRLVVAPTQDTQKACHSCHLVMVDPLCTVFLIRIEEPKFLLIYFSTFLLVHTVQCGEFHYYISTHAYNIL